jgi:hypothetical protein
VQYSDTVDKVAPRSLRPTARPTLPAGGCLRSHSASLPVTLPANLRTMVALLFELDLHTTYKTDNEVIL